jgi:LysM repeat protein
MKAKLYPISLGIALVAVAALVGWVVLTQGPSIAQAQFLSPLPTPPNPWPPQPPIVPMPTALPTPFPTMVPTAIPSRPVVQLTSGSYSAAESAGSVVISVYLNQAASQQVTVNYATSNGTAAAGNDYVAANGTLIFNPGQTTAFFNISLINDVAYESAETINIILSSPANADLGTTYMASLTLVDDDSNVVPATPVTPITPPTRYCRYYHPVQYGDTLYALAYRYHTTVWAIADANHIMNPNLIFAGQTLCIP